MDILQEIQRLMADGESEFTIPHFFEEMADDDLILPDIEMAIAQDTFVSILRATPVERATRLLAPPPMNARLLSFVASKALENSS